MQELWQAFGDKIINVLPRSPFVQFLENIDMPFLPFLNWVLPVGDMVKVFGAWLGAISVFYLVQIVLRWVKVIQG